MAFKRFVDMELGEDEVFDLAMPIAMPSKPAYPPGLRISLTGRDLEKLGLAEMPARGETIEFEVLARVTEVRDGEGGCFCELQIEKIEVEDDDEEDE